MSHLLTGTASLAACLSLWMYARHRTELVAFTSLASALFLLTLFKPALWTPEFFVASEAALSVGAVLCAMSAARRANARPDVMFSALCLALTAWVAGSMALVHVPMLEHFAYRGTAFLDIAVCAVLATVSGRCVLEDRLDSVSLRWLALTFALSGVRLLMFEAHRGLGLFCGWLQVGAWTTAMLGIAWQAIARSQRALRRR